MRTAPNVALATSHRPLGATMRPKPARGASDVSGSWWSRGWFEGPRGAGSIVTSQSKRGDDGLNERDEGPGLVREAFGETEAQRGTVRRAVLRLALIGRAARHVGVHRHRRFHSICPAISGPRRADEGSQEGGRDEQGQNQTMREEPKLHELRLALAGRLQKACNLKTSSSPMLYSRTSTRSVLGQARRARGRPSNV